MSEAPKGLLVIEAGIPGFEERLKLGKKVIGMTDTPMSLRLAMAAWSVLHDEDEPWDDALAIEKHPYMLEVDAILRKMLEPSGSTKRLMSDEFWENYREVIRHIIDQD